MTDFRIQPDKRRGLPGFVGYLTIVLWFLAAILYVETARAEERLTPADIAPALAAALEAEGAPAGVDLAFDAPDLDVGPAPVSLSAVSYNALTGRFVARLENGAAVSGVAAQTVAYPALARAIERGGVIGEADIDFIEAPARRGERYVQDADELVGSVARRSLRAGVPVRALDVAAPRLIDKGALVTMTLEAGPMRISHQGVALGAGGKGEIIAVRNIQSDRVVKAVVAGENLVRIAPRGVSIEG